MDEKLIKNTNGSGKELFGQGKFKDTGRESSGYGESIDSLIGAPARLAIQEAQNGNISMDALKKIFHQIGSDPRTAPTGYDIASKVTDNPALGTFLSTAVDFGAQLPGTQFLHPGVVGEIKNIKGIDNLIDASEAFKKLGEKGPSTEVKIAQLHGTAGKVKDAMPALIAGAKQEASAPKAAARKNVHADEFWHDPNDNSFTDEAKKSLDHFANRFGYSKDAISDLEKSNQGPDHMPYNVDPSGTMVGIPNFSAKPTGQIGNPGISGPKTSPDPFSWADHRYGAGKQLLQRHKSLGMPADIHTSSDLIGHEDYIKEIPKDSTVHLYFGPMDKELHRQENPGNPSNLRLEQAAQGLQDAGVNVNKVYPEGENVKPIKPEGFAKGGVVGMAGGGLVPDFANDKSLVKGSANDTINVVDPFGKVGSLPMIHAEEAMNNGYKPATLDEINQAKNEERFGGFSGSIFAGTLGLARSATLGASDLALTHLPDGVGFSPEELRGFRETNPTSTLAGEIGGILKDPLGLAKVITSTGKATTAGAKAAIKYVTGAEDASKVVNTLTSTLGHGVEGGLYSGIAGTVDEKALGDPSLNGEKILANIGYGSLIGGSFGGLSKMLGYGITPAIRSAMKGLSNIRDDLIGSGFGEEALVHKVLPKRFAEAITDRQLNLDTNGQASLLRKMVTNLNSVKDNIQEEISGFDSEIDKKAKSSLFNAHSKLASDHIANVAGFLSNTIDKLQALIPEGPSKVSLEALKNKSTFYSTIGGSAETVYNSLKSLKGYIGDFIAREPILEDTLAPVVSNINDIIKDPAVFGPAGAASALHDENVSQLSKFLSQDSKKLTSFQEMFGAVKGGKWQFDIKKMNEVLADKDPIRKARSLQGLDEFFSTLKDMPENILNARRAIPNSRWKKETLAQIVENSEKTSKEAFNDYIEGVKKRRPMYGWRDYAPVLIAKWYPVIAAALEAYDFYQDPVHATHEFAVIERLLSKAAKGSLDLIDQIFDPSFATKAIPRIPGVKKGPLGHNDDSDLNDIKKYSFNPELFSSAMTKSTAMIQKSAPRLAEHLNLATGNAISFLASKAPQTNEHLNPLDEVQKPDNAAMSKFERYRSVVENPLVALEQIRDRTLVPETIESLSLVYPKLYESLKQSLIEKTFSEKAKGRHIPYQTKQAISMFLGQPLASSLSPQMTMANQMAFAMAPQPNQPKPSLGGLKELKSSDRSNVQRPRPA